MASQEINMKEISNDLKSSLTKEIENKANKITLKIIVKINSKFGELSTRMEAVDRETEVGESLAK